MTSARRLVDVVNFNADASCLSAAEWLRILADGPRSKLHRWLELYVERNKRVTLGIVGGAVADIAKLNPQVIALINAHPQIFEMVLRPFAHDVTLLRLPEAFQRNVQLGRHIITSEFGNVVPFFLPAEFMLTSEQVKLLSDDGVAGVFINSSRFKDEVQQLIPTRPYVLKGVLGSQLDCIPFRGELTQRYLDALHDFDATGWNRGVTQAPVETVFTWRDGESPFLIPNGIEREDNWLAEEAPEIVRTSLRDELATTHFAMPPDDQTWRSYPVHSFTAWLKEFRMLGYLERVRSIERRIDELSDEVLIVWLQAINSDVLSAVEKDSPIVSLSPRKGAKHAAESFVIRRSERGFEGEEYLALAERLLAGGDEADAYLRSASAAHMLKLTARIHYFRKR